MVENYEFKLRMLDDVRTWENIPPHDRQALTKEQAGQRAVEIAKHPAMVEVRYNVVGSPQGHYVAGSLETRELHRQRA